MREIKFRAWNGSKLEYDVVVGRFGAFYGAGLDPKDSASFTPYNTIYSVGTPIMQYTGLKDKNGVEIYEGDIIKYITQYYGNKLERQKVVEWIDDMQDDSFGEPLSMGYRFYGGDTEVVGNIYENHELLKEVK